MNRNINKRKFENSYFLWHNSCNPSDFQFQPFVSTLQPNIHLQWECVCSLCVSIYIFRAFRLYYIAYSHVYIMYICFVFSKISDFHQFCVNIFQVKFLEKQNLAREIFFLLYYRFIKAIIHSTYKRLYLGNNIIGI